MLLCPNINVKIEEPYRSLILLPCGLTAGIFVILLFVSVPEAGDGGDPHLLQLDDLLAPAVHLLVTLLHRRLAPRLAHHQPLLLFFVLKNYIVNILDLGTTLISFNLI